MHLMIANYFTLYRFKGSGPHVQSNLFAGKAFCIQAGQYFGREMESRRWSGHRTFYFGVDRLIGLQIAFAGFTVQIGRNR